MLKTAKDERFKRQGGITLIALIITIIVLLILTGVAFGAITGENGILKRVSSAAEETRGASVEEEVSLWKTDVEMAKYTGGETESVEDIVARLQGNGLLTADEAAYVLDTTNNPDMLVEIGSRRGDRAISFKADRVIVGSDIIGDGNWNEDKGMNSPKLVAGMTAVVYNSSKTSEADGLPAYWDEAKSEEEWYNYVAQTGSTDETSRWANAVTEDGSFWVWIPRYEYKIDYIGIEQGVNTDITKSGVIDVRFIPTNTQLGTTDYTEEANKIVKSSDGYIIHPVFTNNVDQGGWNSEISRNMGSKI